MADPESQQPTNESEVLDFGKKKKKKKPNKDELLKEAEQEAIGNSSGANKENMPQGSEPSETTAPAANAEAEAEEFGRKKRNLKLNSMMIKMKLLNSKNRIPTKRKKIRKF